ncbi:MAG: transposase, partial [Nitrospiria bacterium]
EHAYCDKGYRGAAEVPGTMLHLTNKKKKHLTRSQWRWLRRRSAIEPVFGHLKSDNGLERNHLQGKAGDQINAILAGCGFNLRKLLRAFFVYILNRLIGAHRSRKREKSPLGLKQCLA